MKRTNVIVIVADDMGYGDVGRFGDGSAQTPALNQLAEEGICLSQHYSASAVCAPARASLMTGRYPHRTGVVDTLEATGLDRLSLDEVTLGDVFQQAGYRTGLVGKWHLGTLGDAYHPMRRGFQEFLGFRGGWSDYYAWSLDDNGTTRQADGRYLTDVFTDEAIGFIRRHKEEPFLLHVAYNAPHFPFQCPSEDVERFAQTGKFTQRLSTLYGMIYRMDRGIGQILQELKTLGIDERTFVLFTSDNGPQLGGQGEQCIDRYNAGMRGEKGTVFDGGIKVPAILKWPGVLREGVLIDAPVHFNDWLPTLASVAEIDLPASLQLDGRNRLPALRGEEPSVSPPFKSFWQWNRYKPVPFSNAAMRDKEWKLVRPVLEETMRLDPRDIEMDRKIKQDPDSFVETIQFADPDRPLPPAGPSLLFNLKEDPGESENKAALHPDRVRTMQHELDNWFADVVQQRSGGKGNGN